MKLNKLYLKDFRSYDQSVFEFSDGVNVICGANGLGKTNLLESIYLLSGTRSWRAVKNNELIKWERDTAYIYAAVFSRGRDFEMKINLSARGRSTEIIPVSMPEKNPWQATKNKVRSR